MAIDASIYQNLRQLTPVETPDFAGSLGKAMTLKHLALQSAAQERSNADAEALRDAYAKNMGADGKLDRQGALAMLGKTSPAAAMQLQDHLNKTDKDSADLDKSKIEAAQKTLSITQPIMDQLAGMDPQSRAAAFPQAMKHLESLGVPIHNVPAQYDEGWFQHAHTVGKNTMDYLNGQKAQADLLKAPLERQKLRGEIGEQTFKVASDLRKERAALPTTKETQILSTSYNKIQRADATPAGDMSLIYGFMKINDPNSGVKEGEYATAQNAAGVPERVRTAYNNVLRGEKLSREQRADFKATARGLYEAHISQQRKIDRDYERIAVKQGANPDDVLTDFDADLPGEGGAPQMLAGKKQGGGFIPEANASGVAPKTPEKVRMPKFNVGALVNVGGRHYTVGPDGDTLIEVKAKKGQ